MVLSQKAFQSRFFLCYQPSSMVFPNSPSCQSHGDFISHLYWVGLAKSNPLICLCPLPLSPPNLTCVMKCVFETYELSTAPFLSIIQSTLS